MKIIRLYILPIFLLVISSFLLIKSFETPKNNKVICKYKIEEIEDNIKEIINFLNLQNEIYTNHNKNQISIYSKDYNVLAKIDSIYILLATLSFLHYNLEYKEFCIGKSCNGLRIIVEAK